eukprot:3357471-Pyramimonas_sp.AAC.1
MMLIQPERPSNTSKTLPDTPRNPLALDAVRSATLYEKSFVIHDADSARTSSSLRIPRRRFPSSASPRYRAIPQPIL